MVHLHSGPTVVAAHIAPDGRLAVQRSAATVEIVNPVSGRTTVLVGFLDEEASFPFGFRYEAHRVHHMALMTETLSTWAGLNPKS